MRPEVGLDVVNWLVGGESAKRMAVPVGSAGVTVGLDLAE